MLQQKTEIKKVQETKLKLNKYNKQTGTKMSLSPIKVCEVLMIPDAIPRKHAASDVTTIEEGSSPDLSDTRSVEESSPTFAADTRFHSLDLTRHTPQCVHKFNSVEAASGSGCWIRSTDDVEYLDLSSGIGVLSTGHCHPRVVQAAQEQCGKMIFAQQNCVYTTQKHKELIGKMLEIMPNEVSTATSSSTRKPLDSFFFCNAGTEAVENAVKIARMVTKKQNIIVLTGGYHGRTYGSMACTSSKTTYRRCFGPLMGGVHFCDFDVDQVVDADPAAHEKYTKQLIANFERLITQQTDVLETAAVLLEPILGEGGIVQVPHEFLRYLRKKCDDNHIMLIFDEVQSGFGRTGKWFASEHANVQPDILVYAKGIASGFPLAGVAANQEDVMSKLLPNALGGTFGGSAVAVAAACATIDVIEDEGLLENAEIVGLKIFHGLQKLNEKTRNKDGACFFSGFRQYGLFIAADLNSFYSSTTAGQVIKKAETLNMIMIGGGKNGLRVTPPLVFSTDEADIFLSKFEEVVFSLI